MDGKKEEFRYYLQNFEAFINNYQEQMNANSRMIAFVYFNLSRLNLVFLTQNYSEGLTIIPDIEAEMPLYESHTDAHRLLLFYYKFASLHFCNGNYNGALDYLNEIVQLNITHLREDLHIFARILQIICHYELDNYDLLTYLITSVERQYEKCRDLGQLPELLLQLLKELTRRPKYEAKILFAEMETTIRELANSPYEKKSMVFLNPLLWLQSHRKNKPIIDLNELPAEV
jgi:hypothetical protein